MDAIFKMFLKIIMSFLKCRSGARIHGPTTVVFKINNECNPCMNLFINLCLVINWKQGLCVNTDSWEQT
jgi:hypothetical protein